MSRLNFGSKREILYSWFLSLNNSGIGIGDLYFRIFKSSTYVKYLYKFIKLKKPFPLNKGLVCSSTKFFGAVCSVYIF